MTLLVKSGEEQNEVEQIIFRRHKTFSERERKSTQYKVLLLLLLL